MTVVVQMCHHFHVFSRKSTLGQITSSLNESKIHSAEEELNRWADLIKDEANLLLSQTTENEAAENRNMRNWLSRSIKSNSRQQETDRQLQWMNTLSTFDYETPWKQARKRGSSSFFVDTPDYKDWKQRHGPSSLLLSGKMGCGKSVIMANMVDDLSISCPDDVIIYFFCRHDIPESLKARTVFGSFAAQILQRYLGTNTMGEPFINSAPSIISLDKILDVLPTMIRRIEGIRLILDGVDECPEQEFDLIRNGLLRLSSECSILSCVSYRDQADGLQAKIWNTGYGAILSVPDDNPDIHWFIEEELQRRKESGKLSIGDPRLLIMIREALLCGANGMFLWVVLQIDTICAERTDHSIRQALDNLPETLSGTFRRILEKSKQGGHCYQRDILKILIGADRPLTVAEFREALSVSPGDTAWDPRKLINDIYSTLACCGSLVIIDEEEMTVRLLHQSVAQFLQTAGADSMEWAFTAQDANSYLGEVCVTYLSYGVFDKRVSTRVIPQFHVGGAAGTIVTQTLSPFGTIGRKLSDTVIKRQKPSDRDIGKTLFKFQSSKTVHEDFKFFDYSSKNFMSHTSRMSHASSMTIQLFRHLLLIHPQYTSWLENEDSSSESVALGGSLTLSSSNTLPGRSSSHLPPQSEMAPKISPQLQWAISHSHSLAFSMSLHDRLSLRTLLYIVRYLSHLRNAVRQLNLARHMCDKLLIITTLFRCSGSTDWLISMHRYSLKQYLELLESSGFCQWPTTRWAVLQACFVDLSPIVDSFIEKAIAHQDLQTIKSLLEQGTAHGTYSFVQSLQAAMRLSSSNPEYLLPLLQTLRTTARLDDLNLNASDVDSFLSSLFQYAHPIMALGLVQTILNNGLKMSAEVRNALLCVALSLPAHERAEIIDSLSSDRPTSNQSYMPVVKRALQLRDWHSASRIEWFQSTRLEVSRSILQSCIDAWDSEGIEFILNFTTPTQGQEETDALDDDHSYPLFSVMASQWNSLPDCYRLLKFAVSIQDTSLRLTDEARIDWAVYGDDHSVLNLCWRVLEYLVYGGHLSDASLYQDYGLKATILFHLNALLESFSGYSPHKPLWIDITAMVLQTYRRMTAWLSDLHRQIGRGISFPPEIFDRIDILRLSTVRIAETLLRKPETSGSRIFGWQIDNNDRSIICCSLGDWSPYSLMGIMLRLHGCRSGTLPEKKDFSQAIHMPLGWQAFAIGPQVVELFRMHGIALNELRAAELCFSSRTSCTGEMRIEKTIMEWRASTNEGFTPDNCAELRGDEHHVPLPPEYSSISDDITLFSLPS